MENGACSHAAWSITTVDCQIVSWTEGGQENLSNYDMDLYWKAPNPTASSPLLSLTKHCFSWRVICNETVMACPVEKHTSTVKAQAIGRVVSWNNPGFCNKGSQVIFAFVYSHDVWWLLLWPCVESCPGDCITLSSACTARSLSKRQSFLALRSATAANHRSQLVNKHDNQQTLLYSKWSQVTPNQQNFLGF